MNKLSQIQDKNGNYVLGFMQELVIALMMNGLLDFTYNDGNVIVGKYTLSPIETEQGTYIEVHRKYDLIREVYTTDDIDSLADWLFYQ